MPGLCCCSSGLVDRQRPAICDSWARLDRVGRLLMGGSVSEHIKGLFSVQGLHWRLDLQFGVLLQQLKPDGIGRGLPMETAVRGWRRLDRLLLQWSSQQVVGSLDAHKLHSAGPADKSLEHWLKP